MSTAATIDSGATTGATRRREGRQSGHRHAPGRGAARAGGMRSAQRYLPSWPDCQDVKRRNVCRLLPRPRTSQAVGGAVAKLLSLCCALAAAQLSNRRLRLTLVRARGRGVQGALRDTAPTGLVRRPPGVARGHVRTATCTRPGVGGPLQGPGAFAGQVWSPPAARGQEFIDKSRVAVLSDGSLCDSRSRWRTDSTKGGPGAKSRGF